MNNNKMKGYLNCIVKGYLFFIKVNYFFLSVNIKYFINIKFAIVDAVVFVEVVFQNAMVCEIVDHQIEVPFCMVRLCLLYLIIKENNCAVYVRTCGRTHDVCVFNYMCHLFFMTNIT